MDRNIRKTCVFIFHYSIQHDKASGFNFCLYEKVLKDGTKLVYHDRLKTGISGQAYQIYNCIGQLEYF